MKISVLIGSRDRPKMLHRCVRSVLRQEHEDFEVRVLDDGSEQDLCEGLRTSFPDDRLHCHRSDEALGVPGGRNELASHAQGEVLCFIDDDARFADRRALAKTAEAFRSLPQAGSLAFKITDYLPGGARLATPYHAATTLRRRPELAHQPAKVSHFLGRGHAVRRVAFEQCSGFDETLHFGGEERDLAYRLIEAGYSVQYVPSVHVEHWPAPSPIDANGGGKIYYFTRNRLRVTYRHIPWPYLAVHAGLWIARYGAMACRQRQVKEFVRGVIDGMKDMGTTRRTPVSKAAVRYLKANYGQLWY